MGFILYGLAFVGGLTLVVLLIPTPRSTRERIRAEQATAKASWRIHQQAIDAFGKLLEAARSHDETEQDS